MNQLDELLYQALETELGGVKVYETAVRCAVRDELREEWAEYLEQTREHVSVVQELLAARELDAELLTPGRKVVRHIGESLVQAMEMALQAGDPNAAQIVAAECVVLAETKDHLNWELIGQVVRNADDGDRDRFKTAHSQVEDQEDEHLYHTTGWCRELWIESLGMPAVLPPPEERKDVRSAIAAARAKQARLELVPAEPDQYRAEAAP